MAENTRVYGMADQANRQPPATQGVRGERSSAQPSDGEPEFSHTVTLDNGKTVVVSEGSGTSYAEATGRIGRSEQEAEIDFVPEFDTKPRSRLPLLLAALAAGAAGGAWLAGRLRRPDKLPRQPSLVFGGDPGGGVGTRNVGHQSAAVIRPDFSSPAS